MRRDERALAGIVLALAVTGGILASVPSRDVGFDELGRMLVAQGNVQPIPGGPDPTGPPNVNCPCGATAS